MSKEATIIQSFNDVKRQYEYSVKGYDVTESIKILLKRHKEEYDKEKKIFAGIDGYLEAQKKYQSQIADLEAKLAEKEKQILSLKKKKIRKLIDTLNEAYKSGALTFNEMFACIWIENILKQQLVEKDKEIEDLKAQRHIYLNRSVEECNRITDLEFELQHKDQDKISFAVDALKIAQDYVQEYVNDFDDKNDCLCAIDKQIKQLTYQHEDKGENK